MMTYITLTRSAIENKSAREISEVLKERIKDIYGTDDFRILKYNNGKNLDITFTQDGAFSHTKNASYDGSLDFPEIQFRIEVYPSEGSLAGNIKNFIDNETTCLTYPMTADTDKVLATIFDKIEEVDTDMSRLVPLPEKPLSKEQAEWNFVKYWLKKNINKVTKIPVFKV